jgi:hypothetical protein
MNEAQLLPSASMVAMDLHAPFIDWLQEALAQRSPARLP